MIKGYAYFPSLIYVDEILNYTESVKNITNKYFFKLNSELSFKQTENFNKDQSLKFFTDYLIYNSLLILEQQGYLTSKYKFFVSGLWGQQIENGAGTDRHIHKNSQLSGWLFLETPENGSYPIFFDPRIQKKSLELDFLDEEKIKNSTSAIHFKKIKPGTIIFANSWLEHLLTGNFSDKPTKCIHFIISCGEIDENYSTNY